MIFSHSKLLNKYANLTHAFTNKKSGNLAFHVGDDPLHVEHNHQKLANKLNYDKRTLVHMKQIHSDIVHIVDDNDNFENPPTCDALITNKTNTPLMVMVADCSAILFYNDKTKTIALAHAGRQGAFKNIVKNVIGSFKNDFNSQASSIDVAIGASIGVCCYEVGLEIYNEAKELGFLYAVEIRDDKYYLDIRKILKKQLLDLGVKNIEISDECNCCRSDKYFSYRKEAKTGRFGGVIELKSLS
jgi:YfiH family protein